MSIVSKVSSPLEMQAFEREVFRHTERVVSIRFRNFLPGLRSFPDHIHTRRTRHIVNVWFEPCMMGSPPNRDQILLLAGVERQDRSVVPVWIRMPTKAVRVSGRGAEPFSGVCGMS